VYLSLNLVRIPRSPSYSSLFNYFTLGVPTLGLLVILYNFLILRLNTLSTFPLFIPYPSLTKYFSYSYLILRILYYRKLLPYAYSYIFKLSCYSLLLVFVHHMSLSYSYLTLRILGFSYLILRILSL
jgi:hypothetical protein